MKIKTPFDKERYLKQLLKMPSVPKATYKFYQSVKKNVNVINDDYKMLGMKVETLSKEMNDCGSDINHLVIHIGANNLKYIKPYLLKLNHLSQRRAKAPYTLIDLQTHKQLKWSKPQLQKAIKLYWDKFDNHYCYQSPEAKAINQSLQTIRQAQKQNDYITILKAYLSGAKQHKKYIKQPQNHNMEKFGSYHIQNGYHVLQNIHSNQADMKYAKQNGLYTLYRVNYQFNANKKPYAPSDVPFFKANLKRYGKDKHITLASIHDLTDRLDTMINDIEIQQRIITQKREINEKEGK